MTAILRINGITIPVADGSVQVDVEEVGDSPRAINAQQLIGRRAVKTTWSGETVLDTAANALAYRDLILGQKSQAWALDAHLYSAKGLPLTAFSGVQTVNGNTSRWANATCWSWPYASTIVAADGYSYSTMPWTVSYWAWLGSAWNHYVETSANQKYIDGVNVGPSTVATPSSTSLTLTSNGAWYIDDLWISQYLWPTTWPAMVSGYALPTGPASRINVDGLMVEANSRTVICRGQVESLQMRQAMQGGVIIPNMQSVRFKLIEV